MAKEISIDEFESQGASPKEMSIDEFEGADPPVESKQGVSSAESFGRSWRQGATWGLSDEAGAGADVVGDEIDPALDRIGVQNPSVRAALKTMYAGANLNPLIIGGRALKNKINTGEFTTPEYRAVRDVDRARDAAAAEAHPALSAVGNVAGALSNPLNYVGLGAGAKPVQAAAYLPKVGGAIASGAKAGALPGAVYGLGGSSSDDATGVLADTAAGAVTGALTGGLVSGGIKGVTAAPEAIGGVLEDLAAKRAVQAANPLRSVLDKISKKGEGAQIDFGNQLLDEGIVGWANTPAKMQSRNAGLMKAAGERIDKALSPFDDAATGTFQPKNIQSKILEKYGQNPDLQADVSKALDLLRSKGGENLTPSVGRELRQIADDGINYNKFTDNKIKDVFKKDVANMIRSELYRSVKESADAIGRPELYEEFVKGNAQYNLASKLEKSMAGNLSKTFQSGGGKPLAKSWQDFVPGFKSGASAIGKTLGNPKAISTAADGFKAIGDAVSQIPQVFGRLAPILQAAAQRGPAALASTTHVLSQTSEEFRQKQRELNGSQEPNQ